MLLAYVLNLFPVTAKCFLQRVALLSGRNPEYFVNFMQCEYVGQVGFFRGGFYAGRLDNLAVSPGMRKGSIEAPFLCSTIGRGRA